MEKIYKKESFAGNNSLDKIIIRVDFLTLEQQDLEKIIEKISQNLGEEYKYSKIDNYNINLDISDPKKLITQDFIEQKVDLKNNYEFKEEQKQTRFVMNQNFFLYERRNFNDYEGSDNDTNLFIKLLGEIFEYKPQIQRLGVRKINCFYTKKELKYLKKIIKVKFINRIEKDINPRYKMSYTPLESNDKDGYNLNMQLDYGILNKDEKNSEVYRYILDIDSYVRDIDKINDLKKVSSEILQLKNKDFEIYVGELQEKFLDVMISRNSKSEFDENIKKFGIIHGVNYGKQL